jgi:membrane fusion protein, multidrug efflux system
MKKTIYTAWSLAFLLSTGFMACSDKKKNTAKKEEPPTIVEVAVAQPQHLSSTIEVNGSVVANEYVELHTEVSGRLTYLHIPEGTVVPQGTVIARINDADLQAQSNKVKVQLDLAQKTEQRLAKLLGLNGINQSDYDAALNQVNSLKSDLGVLQAQIDKTVLKAPFTGIIGLRKVSLGAYLSPTITIATLQQTSKLKVDFVVPEEYAKQLKKGAVIDVSLDEQRNYKATIIAIEPQINTTTRNIQIRAILQQGNPQPGSFVKVGLKQSDRQSIMMPTHAIIPDDRNKKMVIVVGGKAKYVKVETGVRQSDMVEITNGISVGDSVVITGVLFAKPDKPVKVKKKK